MVMGRPDRSIRIVDINITVAESGFLHFPPVKRGVQGISLLMNRVTYTYSLTGGIR